MTPVQLRVRIEKFPVRFTLSDDLIRRLWPHYRGRDERQHWIDWLHDHERRQTPAASRVYDRLQSPGMVLWLADAALVSERDIIDAAKDASGPWRPARTCSILRAHIPWLRIARNLREGRAP